MVWEIVVFPISGPFIINSEQVHFIYKCGINMFRYRQRRLCRSEWLKKKLYKNSNTGVNAVDVA